MTAGQTAAFPSDGTAAAASRPGRGGDDVPLVLRPAVGLTARLRTGVRLAVLVLVLLVPGLGASWAYADAMGSQVDFTRAEESGLRVLRPTLAAMADAVAGRPVDLAPVEAAAAAEPGLDLTEALGAVRAAVEAPDSTTPAGRVAVADAFVGLATQIGNVSNLILDPDLDSFYVMDALVVQVPRALAAAAAAAAPPEQAGTGRGQELVAAQAVRAGTLSGAAAALRGDSETALANTSDADLAGRLAPLAAAAEAGEAFAAEVTADLGRAVVRDPSPVADAARAAAGPAADGLEALLGTRADGLSTRRAEVLAATGLGLVLAIWFAAGVSWRTTSDVRRALVAVAAMADGDRTEHPLPRGRDELGDLGRAVATTRARLAEQAEELVHAQAQREQELRHRMENQAAAERQVRDRAQGIVDETAESVSEELRLVVEQVAAVRVAAATIDERVAETDAVARDVVARAGEAEAVVTSLEESLREVGRMADLISGVADQTRLLALNATIEAARAGSAGRGFSVVANEVKELAATTGRSTIEITATVNRLREQAEHMARSIGQMAAGIGSVDEATAVLSNVAAEQRDVVGRLDASITETIQRVEGMSSLTERLERRRLRRVRVDGPGTLTAGGRTVAVRLLDVGEGGVRCYVAPPENLDRGSSVTLEAVVGGRTVRAEALVAHRTPAGDADEIGLQFTTVAPDVVHFLRRFAEDESHVVVP